MKNMENLESSKLFQLITEEETQRILKCSKARMRQHPAGTYIFEQGGLPTRLFLLLSGQVQICKDFTSGKRDVLYLVEPGNVFGEIFLFGDRKKYWYDAVAVTDVSVLEMPWDFFYHFCSNACDHHKQLTQNMLEILSEDNFKITRKLHIISTSSLRERIAIWLIDSMNENSVVELRMNREQLADFLGVARPSLSRELMRMQKDGLIEVSRKTIRICDRDAVEMLYG
ncbi:Crp/Fnr family transcriptional regulator [bacterium 1xD8-48]|jgi:CRP-like cAMP-binding protein|nr:Crp/Fnr family transcriptional regulator [Lachnospiraceae bacterium]NBJ99117.1 Crp/Fnr family transcriptional regulator [bacterium 1xD8-48]